MIDATAAAVAAALAEPDLARVAAAVRARGCQAECDRVAGSLTTHNGGQQALGAIKTALADELATCAPGAFERWLLLRLADRSLARVPALPVADAVRRLICEAFGEVAAPAPGARFDVARSSFVARCEIATLRRFPAGQLDWNLSGLPRSWLLKVTGRERLALLWWVASRLRGFHPVFVPHLNPNRRHRTLTERESDRSYYRMAQSLRRQPQVRGLVGSSWLRSPDTFLVSPHLAFMNRPIVDNGGLVVTMGPADPDSGVLVGSSTRRKAYEQGTFRPTIGLAIWPRDAMLAWADRHPELGEEGGLDAAVAQGADAGRDRSHVAPAVAR